MPDPAANPRRTAARHAHWARMRRVLRLVFAPVAIVLAILYFLIDGIVLSLLRPLMRRLAAWMPLARLREWVATLGPYPTLALVLVPIIVLEPLKPVALYLMAKRHVFGGTVVLVLTELVKVVAVERLFHLALPKLMTIPLFARGYNFTVGSLAYLQSLPPWQFVLRRVDQIKRLSRRLAAVVRGWI